MTLWNFYVCNDWGKLSMLSGDDDELVIDFIVEKDGKSIHSMFLNEHELRGLAINAAFMADYLKAKTEKQITEENK